MEAEAASAADTPAGSATEVEAEAALAVDTSAASAAEPIDPADERTHTHLRPRPHAPHTYCAHARIT